MMRRQWQRWRGPILLVGFLAIALLAVALTDAGAVTWRPRWVSSAQ